MPPHYLGADFQAEGYDYQIDLKLDLSRMEAIASEQIDLLIACDVFEHVPDHLGAMREIHRVLKPGGWAVLTVPQKDDLPKTFEDPAVQTPEDREQVFGQFDHLRIYGHDFADFLMQAGFSVRTISEKDFSPQLVNRLVLFPPRLSNHPLATNYRKVFLPKKPRLFDRGYHSQDKSGEPKKPSG